jgi:RNA polymerase sigma factor (sigma-70 family)
MMTDDMELVRSYAASDSEQAFAALVERHIGLVHSAAMRQVGNECQAQEITQAVFILLARKAKALGPGTILPAWLYRTTRYVAADVLKTQRRRRQRELQAYMRSTLDDERTESAWTQLAPLLEEAMAELGEQDRTALVLRYFENQPAAQVAAALNLSEAAAHKRVERAVDKLRRFFSRRRVVSTGALIAAAISAHSVQAVPAALAKAVTSIAAAKGGAVGGSSLVLAEEAIRLMSWTKAKVATAAAALAVFAGTGLYEVGQNVRLRTEVRQFREQQPALVRQLGQWQQQRDAATKRLDGLNLELTRMQAARNASGKGGDLLKLRGQVGLLRRQVAVMEMEAAARAAGYPKGDSDPVNREALRQDRLRQCRMALGGLAKDLQLTPEQTDKAAQALYQVIQEGIDKWFVLPRGALNSDQLSQFDVEREAALQTELRPYFGEEGCARLVESMVSRPAEATAELLNGELGAGQLSEEQKRRLMEILKAEPYRLTRGMGGDWDPAFWGSQDYVDDHLLEITESNQRVLDQAHAFLSPDQLNALSAVFSNGITFRISLAAGLLPGTAELSRRKGPP